MFFRKKPLQFIGRGDPAVYDFTLTDFTTNDAYHDLDLSAIIPKGTKLVLLRVVLIADAGYRSFHLRTNGQSNEINRAYCRTVTGGSGASADLYVVPDANGVIEYKASNITWTNIDICIAGWFV